MRSRFGAAVLAAGLLLSGCSLLPKEEPEPLPKLVAPPSEQKPVYTVRRGAIADRLKLLGTVAAQQEAALYFRQGGRVREALVHLGDSVAAGAPLAVLENDAQNRIAMARLDLEAAQVRLEAARPLVGFKNGYTEADLKLKEIDVERAQLNLQQAQQALADATITAPFAGVVTDSTLKVGDQVNAFQPVLKLADPSHLEVRATVTADADWQRVGLHQKVQVVLGVGGGARELAGSVVAKSDSDLQRSQPGTPPHELRVAFDGGTPQGVNLGDLVQLTITVREKSDALLVPTAAVRKFLGRNYVQQVVGESRREVDVEVGIEGETDTEIVRGLKEGDQVLGK